MPPGQHGRQASCVTKVLYRVGRTQQDPQALLLKERRGSLGGSLSVLPEREHRRDSIDSACHLAGFLACGSE